MSAAQEKPSPIEAAAIAITATLLGDSSVSFIACDCGRDVQIETGTQVSDVRSLLEHAAFEHSSRRPIDVYRTVRLVRAFELGAMLGLPALTEAEESWRRNAGLTYGNKSVD